MKLVSKCCSAPPIGDLEIDLDRKVGFGYCKDCGGKSSFIEEVVPEFTPDNITKLPKNGVFVFGSNESGRHGLGAALTALKKYGAVYGQGAGLQGRSYAIPTKDHNIQTLPLSAVKQYVDGFLSFAATRPDLVFYVTKIGCGLAGLRVEDIKPMFAVVSKNVILPKEFSVTTTTKTKTN